MKLRSWQGGLFVLALAVVSCSGNEEGNSDVDSSLQVLASNVVFSSAVADESAALDTETKVLAENVVVDTSKNALSSENVQDALDNEIAIDLATLFPGTTWTITNKTTDSFFSGTSGEITFSATGDSFTINSGSFAAAGMTEPSVYSGCVLHGSATYELLSNSVMYVTWKTPTTQTELDATITIIAKSKKDLTLIGMGGCGTVGILRISNLTL